MQTTVSVEEENALAGSSLQPNRKGDEEMAAGTKSAAEAADERRPEPDSFSRIGDLDMDDAELKQRFPDFPGKALATEIVVNEGASAFRILQHVTAP